MQLDFHYYATYCAACLAGYSHEESLLIGYSAQFVDCCSRTVLTKLKAPVAAATTQTQLELVDMLKDILGLQDITRIWSSFHFLPGDLYAKKKGALPPYLHKYRLICNVNSDLLVDTVKLARDGSLQAAGVAMHVLADTWAHRYFAGTPSYVINSINHHFFELVPEEDGFRQVRLVFRHNPSIADDPDQSIYVATPGTVEENSILSLGHGRAGHLPDYSYARYKYLPAWGGYEEVLKDNPADYMNAFCQMVYALKYLRGEYDSFEKGVYDREAVSPWREEITRILEKRRRDASEDWKVLGERISGSQIEDFDQEKYDREYMEAGQDGKDDTFLGLFFLAAMEQKSMVTNKIFSSGNPAAGISIDFIQQGFKGIRDYLKLVEKAARKFIENDGKGRKDL